MQPRVDPHDGSPFARELPGLLVTQPARQCKPLRNTAPTVEVPQVLRARDVRQDHSPARARCARSYRCGFGRSTPPISGSKPRSDHAWPGDDRLRSGFNAEDLRRRGKPAAVDLLSLSRSRRVGHECQEAERSQRQIAEPEAVPPALTKHTGQVPHAMILAAHPADDQRSLDQPRS